MGHGVGGNFINFIENSLKAHLKEQTMLQIFEVIEIPIN